jgi:GcrA cell cycle regulator
MSWTDERIEKLTKMWEGGATASQIAEELGGVSRNAVIGKAHRLGLKARPSPVKPNEKSEAPPPKPPRAPAEPAAVPEPRPVAARPVTPEPAPAPVREAVTPAPRPVAAPAEPAPASTAAAPAAPTDAPAPAPQPRIVSVGPGGFLRQGPGDQQAPIPPAPPRRLVPAKPSAEIAGKTTLLDLSEKVCRWPMGHPGEPDFHFCGTKVNPGFPYCVEHCGLAYQAQMPRRDRKPLPFAVPGAKPSGG